MGILVHTGQYRRECTEVYMWFCAHLQLNPYPANVENRVSS